MVNISLKGNKKINVSILNTKGKNVQIKNTIVERIIEHECEYDFYDGDYIITSDVKNQTIETKNKIMKDNIVILKIPIWETSNEANGTTFYIGDGVNYGN